MNITRGIAALKRLALGHPSQGDEFGASRAIRLSSIVLVAFITAFFAWASLVPLDSAIIASGVVVVETKRKKIQHLEGGIIERIMVRNGERVETGQVLAILNQTESAAALELLEAEQDSILALEARLRAELGNQDSIQLPAALRDRKATPSGDAAISGQTSVFKQRKESLRSEISILQNRRAQYSRIVQGLKAQQKAIAEQLTLIEDELKAIQTLYSKGLSPLPKLLSLKRSKSALVGQSGELTASIAENELKANEIDMEILRLKNERNDKVSLELRDAEKRRFELEQQIRTAKGQFTRTRLTAPSSGTVVALSLYSPGEVLKPGETLLEIVPANDRMLIEAQLKPDDADDVRAGIKAYIRLLPFKTKMQPVIEGSILSVSADRLVDNRTGVAYYEAIIEVEREVVSEALGNTELQPGLPAEVIIGQGSHTALEYLLAPLNRRLNHALREQ